MHDAMRDAMNCSALTNHMIGKQMTALVIALMEKPRAQKLLEFLYFLCERYKYHHVITCDMDAIQGIRVRFLTKLRQVGNASGFLINKEIVDKVNLKRGSNYEIVAQIYELDELGNRVGESLQTQNVYKADSVGKKEKPSIGESLEGSYFSKFFEVGEL